MDVFVAVVTCFYAYKKQGFHFVIFPCFSCNLWEFGLDALASSCNPHLFSPAISD
jgi:hypothetical protein